MNPKVGNGGLNRVTRRSFSLEKEDLKEILFQVWDKGNGVD